MNETEELPHPWRAEQGQDYYTIYYNGHVCKDTDHREPSDNDLFKSGNYYQTEEQANKAAEKIQILLRLGRMLNKGIYFEPLANRFSGGLCTIGVEDGITVSHKLNKELKEMW